MIINKSIQMGHNIPHDNWSLDEAQEFLEGWGKHFIQTDVAFNAPIKQQHSINS